MQVVVKARQTVSDIAIQVYGDLRAAPLIAQTNEVSLTDDLAPGTLLECPDVVYDQYIQDYVRSEKVTPATADLVK